LRQLSYVVFVHSPAGPGKTSAESFGRPERKIPEGGYLWRGEFRLWDNEVLMGWYVASEAAVRSKGTLYFVLHPQGLHLRGRWVGMSYDGPIESGWATMAHSEEEAAQLMDSLKTQEPA